MFRLIKLLLLDVNPVTQCQPCYKCQICYLLLFAALSHITLSNCTPFEKNIKNYMLLKYALFKFFNKKLKQYKGVTGLTIVNPASLLCCILLISTNWGKYSWIKIQPFMSILLPCAKNLKKKHFNF